MPRRNDGFGEAVSSPQVPQGRFTFGDSSTSVSGSLVPSHSNSTNCGARTIFGSTGSGLAQVMREGMDDTRVDLTQLEDNDSGHCNPTTPKQISLITEPPCLVSLIIILSVIIYYISIIIIIYIIE
jgi:nucleoprotein TPR